MPHSWEISSIRQQSCLIGILAPPGGASIDWALSFSNMEKPPIWDVMRVSGLPFGEARTQMAYQMLNGGYQWLFQLDADILAQKNTIPQLMSHRLPIVSGLYHQRFPTWMGTSGDYLPVMFNEVAGADGIVTKQPITEFTPGSLVEAAYIPAGCLLVHRSVFESFIANGIKRIFEWTLHQAAEPPGSGKSEDFEFSARARALGYKCIVDSVSANSPVIVKWGNDINILPIEDLFHQIDGDIVNEGNVEIKEPHSELYIYTRPKNSGEKLGLWTKVIHILRHPYDGELLRINPRGGLVDISPNHSLIPHTGYGLLNASKVKIGQKLAMPMLSAKGKHRSKSNQTHQNKFFIGTEELAWLYGFFAAGGYASRSKHPREVSFSNKNLELLAKCQEIAIKHFHSPASIAKGRGADRVIIQSEKICKHFRERFYTTQAEKRIPLEILNAPENIQLAFLRGYWDGDGSRPQNCHYEFPRCSTISPTLAMGIMWLLHYTLNQVCVVATKKLKSGKPGMNLIFSQPNSRGKKDKREIRKISKIQYQGLLYDIETESHDFCTGVGPIKVRNTSIICTHETTAQVTAKGLQPKL